MYKILWIDDEHEQLIPFKARAEENGIILHGYKSLNGGMDELERNHMEYDGVLLDARIFENEKDVPGSESTKYLHIAHNRILSLPKRFEVFVLTGQAKVYESEMANEMFPNIFQKGHDEQTESLFKRMKEAADRLPETQIRHEYKRILDIFDDIYVDRSAGAILLDLLKRPSENASQYPFNDIRKVLEAALRGFNRHGLLPDEYVNPRVRINESYRFLCGKDSSGGTPIEHLPGTHLPNVIQINLRFILDCVQDGSHWADVVAHVDMTKNPFLFKSVLFSLLDFIAWYKIHIDSEPTKMNWRRIVSEEETFDESILMTSEGSIVMTKHDSYGLFESHDKKTKAIIFPDLLALHSVKKGDPCKVILAPHFDMKKNSEGFKVMRFIELKGSLCQNR